MLSVVCWFWTPPRGYRSQFSAVHVNTLRAMVARNYQKPHRFICVTDSPKGIDERVEIVPLWKDFANLAHPWGTRNPSCYRRLRAFSPEIESVFGKRFISLDLDCVIVKDMSPIFDRTEDFIIWGDTHRVNPYNGSMWMMTACARRKVWDEFDPATSPILTKRRGYFGSDQAWLAVCLGHGEARWTKADGVYSYRNDLKMKGGGLPANARITFWHGQIDPWSPVGQRLGWVRQHYRNDALDRIPQAV